MRQAEHPAQDLLHINRRTAIGNRRQNIGKGAVPDLFERVDGDDVPDRAGLIQQVNILEFIDLGGLDGDVFRWDAVTIRRILEISLPAAVEQAALQGGRVFFTFMIASVGAVQFAAHQIAVQIESVSFLPGFGFSVAVMTIVARSLGQGKPDRAERFTKITAGLAFVAMSLMGGIFFLFAESLTRLFIAEPQVVYWGSLCVMVAAFEQPTLALAYVFAGALRGAGDTRWPMYVTILGVWIFRMPLVYICVHVWQYGIVSVWVVTALDFLLRSLILWRRFAGGGWK